MATPKTSIFDFADKFGYNSPFATDWRAEEAEKRVAREAHKKQSIYSFYNTYGNKVSVPAGFEPQDGNNIIYPH